MGDLSSQTRNRTCSPCAGRQNLNPWTTREVLRRSSEMEAILLRSKQWIPYWLQNKIAFVHKFSAFFHLSQLHVHHTCSGRLSQHTQTLCLQDLYFFSNSRRFPSTSACHHLASRHCLCVCACLPSCFSCFRLFATLRTVARQAPLSVGCSRQGHWSGFSFPPPRDLPNPGLEPVSLKSPVLSGGFFTASTTWTSGPLQMGKVLSQLS